MSYGDFDDDFGGYDECYDAADDIYAGTSSSDDDDGMMMYDDGIEGGDVEGEMGEGDGDDCRPDEDYERYDGCE